MMPGDHHELAVVLRLAEKFGGEGGEVLVGVGLLDSDTDRSGVGLDRLEGAVAALGLRSGEDEGGSDR